MARTILIGDVHGCLDELRSLVALVAPAAGDRVVLVGDLVAKGPDSQGVVQFVRESGFLSVRGNHDHHLLRHRRAEEGAKPLKPAHRAVAESMGEQDWRYLETLPLHRTFSDIGLIVVHAGVVPGLGLWSQRPENLMNLRSITPSGEPSKRVDEGVPWASTWRGPERIVFGHDALRGLQQHPFATGLDTGCVYGRALTALILPENRLVSVPARRAWAEPKKP